MAFTAKILSWRFRHLNIAGCLLKRRPTKGVGVTGTPGPPLATPLPQNSGYFRVLSLKKVYNLTIYAAFFSMVSFWAGSLWKSVKVGDNWSAFVVPKNIFHIKSNSMMFVNAKITLLCMQNETSHKIYKVCWHNRYSEMNDICLKESQFSKASTAHL